MKITRIIAREVLDSRGRPTVEAEIELDGGAAGRAIAPSGASTGKHEALELRDGAPARFGGYGVKKAVRNVTWIIAPRLQGEEITSQRDLDRLLVELDGTPNKSRLGANAILAVSLAFAHAAAAADRVPLYRYFAGLAETRPSMPLPMINILSGGLHAGRLLDFQDFLIVPAGARSIMQALEWTWAVYQAALKRCVKSAGYNPQLVADEGGIGPALPDNEAALRLLTAAIRDAGFQAPQQVGIALDVASTHFFKGGRYVLKAEGKRRTPAEMVDFLETLVDRYPIVSIEDGCAEDDWAGWKALTERLGGRVQLLGDDLFVTHPARLKRGIEEGCANAILIKFNQIGTLSETLDAMRMAREAGYRTVVSARSGETEDSTMADLAAGADGGQIKIGSLTRSSRLAKYNQLLRISEDRTVRHWGSGLLPTGPAKRRK